MGEQSNDATIKLVLEHQGAGRLREAAGLCREVLAREPDNAGALSVLGMISCQMGRKDLGVGYAGRAVAVAPGVASYQHNYGEAWLAVGESEQAILAYLRAVALEPGRPEPYLGLGVALQRRGRWEESVGALEKALALGLRQADTYVELAKSLLRCGKLDEAESCLDKAMEAKPEWAEIWQVRGEILGHRQKYGEAVQAFGRAAELAPGYARPHHGAGVVLALAGDFQGAAAAMDRALKLDPNYPEANCGAGAILLRVGRAAEAVPFYEKAVALNPGYLEARADLALAFEKVGRLKEAAGQYEFLAGVTTDEAFFRFQRASVGGGQTPAAAPAELVARLFDKYAKCFDEHLTKYLGYRAPQLIFQAVGRAGAGQGLSLLDLGCGTGLCGQLFKPMAAKLVGVDLSPAMVEKARERGIYERLEVGDLIAFTGGLGERFGLVTASDVFCYLGDLGPIFEKVHGVLRPEGLFAFTVEAMSDAEASETGYVLRQTRRYAHAEGYVAGVAGRLGFVVVSVERMALRTENKKDVEGWVVVLRRGSR